MDLSQLVSPGLWCLTLTSGLANVAVKDRVALSRICNATTVMSVTADYGWQYMQRGDAAHLAGLIIFSTVAARTGLIAARDFSDKTRGRIVVGAFALSTALSVASQLTLKHGFDPWTLLPIAGGGIGCFADYTKDMVVRRRSFMAGGATSLVFGAITNSWGLAAKNLVADLGANGYFMWKYKDPWPTPRRIAAAAKNMVKKLLRKPEP